MVCINDWFRKRIKEKGRGELFLQVNVYSDTSSTYTTISLRTDLAASPRRLPALQNLFLSGSSWRDTGNSYRKPRDKHAGRSIKKISKTF